MFSFPCRSLANLWRVPLGRVGICYLMRVTNVSTTLWLHTLKRYPSFFSSQALLRTEVVGHTLLGITCSSPIGIAMSVALSDFALIIFASRIIFRLLCICFFIPTLEHFRISYLFRVWYCKGSDIFLIEKLIIGKYSPFNNF